MTTIQTRRSLGIAAALTCCLMAATAGDMTHRLPAQKPPAHAAARIATLPRQELECLATAIWHEAGNQPRRGQIAVGEVVMARTRDASFPSTPCGVIMQKHQFSIVEHGRLPALPATPDAQAMRTLAARIVAGLERSGLSGAIAFHADYVSPNWHLHRLATIGQHVFYSKDDA